MGRIIGPNECGAELEFKTKAHRQHVCIEPLYHNVKHADERAKHRCECGVAWTQDKTIAGSNWSQELDLTPTINKQRYQKKNGDPN